MDLHSIMYYMKRYPNRNRIILGNSKRPAVRNIVNLHYYLPNGGVENLGDSLSKVVYEYVCQQNAIDPQQTISSTKHLYGIGSIILLGLQDATIWGSGFLREDHGKRERLLKRIVDLDVRSVRGPLSREQLLRFGYKCPECYGDPAILLQLIFQPLQRESQRPYAVVAHMIDRTRYENSISIRTADYAAFVNSVVNSKLIISSSLHGIIIAESYGIPAILYLPSHLDDTLCEFKYRDYYYSTGRYSFPIAKTIEEALKTEPCAIPDFSIMRKNILEAFPKDLWEE